jgi:lycopene beta-cyclase
MLDLVLIGGGLANGLLAWRLLTQRPELSFALVEAGPTLGGNHTWSFHGTDVTREQLEWLWVLVSRSWPSHDVGFASGTRRLGGGYHSLRSDDFHFKLMEALKDRVRLRTKVVEVSSHQVTLSTGEVLEAKAVIDARGFSAAPEWPCGYQKFLGLDVELEAPHGLEVPFLMDTRVAQHGAFRFVYSLPWSETRLLVEDTYYADTPVLDLPVLRARLLDYLQSRGLKVRRIEREESAALPIPLSGSAPRFDHPTLGVAGGFFHATTGYSVPFAVELAEAIVGLRELDSDTLTPWLRERSEGLWAQQGFLRLLNRMLFRGTEPEARVKIFESFYKLSEGTIGRFYAGQLTAFDKLKVLARGAPTVPGPRAWAAARSR